MKNYSKGEKLNNGKMENPHETSEGKARGNIRDVKEEGYKNTKKKEDYKG